MNVLIVYYSRGGRTAKVAQEIYNAVPHEKTTIRIHPREKEGGFFKCLAQAKGIKKVSIEDTSFDCAHYDAIVLGTPLWAGRPSPFLKLWIDKAQNMAGKRVALVVTCRGGSGKITDVMEGILKAKGVSITDTLIMRSLFKYSAKKLREAFEFGKEFSKA